MKNIWIFVLVVMICACASTGKNTNTSAETTAIIPTAGVDLDTAIQQASMLINDSLPGETRVALLNFASPTDAFSGYIFEEISIHLVNSRKLVVVDRREIDLILGEMDFRISGELSDESAREIGRILGAQSVVTGSLVGMGDTYRFRTRVINVDSAAIQASSSISVRDESQVQYLLGGQSSADQLAGESAPPPDTREADAEAAAASGGKGWAAVRIIIFVLLAGGLTAFILLGPGGITSQVPVACNLA